MGRREVEERLAAHRRQLQEKPEDFARKLREAGGSSAAGQDSSAEATDHDRKSQRPAAAHTAATSAITKQRPPAPRPPLQPLDIALRIVLYLLLQVLFFYLGFGIAFFVVAGFYFMWITSEQRARRKGELSPFSVFNKNFQEMEGTFSAKQFEKELRYGAGAVRE